MKTAANTKAPKKPGNSALKNIIMAYTAMGKCFPQYRWQLPIHMACRIAAPFMAALVPSLAIRAITRGDVGYFLLSMAAALGTYWVMQMVENITGMHLGHERLYTKDISFFSAFIKKALETDYMNIEPQPKQKLIQKASMAIYCSERLIYETAEFAILIFGLLLYGSAVLTLDARILLVTFVFLFFDVFFRNHAVKYDRTHWEEHTEVRRKRNYLERSSLNISAGKDIRIYQMKECFHTRFNRLIAKEADFQARRNLRWYFPTLSDGICGIVRDILAYGILVGKVLKGEIDVSQFTLYLGIISGLAGYIFPLSHVFHRLEEANMYFQDYFAFMELPDRFIHSKGTSTAGTLWGSAAPTIEFRDVSFSYENAEAPVVSHLNFTIRAGEKVALVGNNGAGKTTLVKLLCGLYPVSGGEILIDGKRLDDMDIDAWQDMISVVFQDAAPIPFSIAMNVAGCAGEALDRGQVKESLKRAGLLEKIEGLPEQEDTYITQQLDDNGILLSGGETQKLLLAKAIYKNGRILVLDEPTAALDPIAESSVYEEYNSLAGGKTSLFISHRLASTKFCDRILFLENGRIIEEGTHAELMGLGGKYKEIFEIQSQYYKKDTTKV